MVKQDSHAYRHAIIEEPGNVVEKGQMSIWSVWGKRKCANSKMGMCKSLSDRSLALLPSFIQTGVLHRHLSFANRLGQQWSLSL